jgi:hypothetical protein
MITRVPPKVFDRLFDASLVTIMGLPPKDPHDDDEEEDEKPVVIREPENSSKAISSNELNAD